MVCFECSLQLVKSFYLVSITATLCFAYWKIPLCFNKMSNWSRRVCHDQEIMSFRALNLKLSYEVPSLDIPLLCCQRSDIIQHKHMTSLSKGCLYKISYFIERKKLRSDVQIISCLASCATHQIQRFISLILSSSAFTHNKTLPSSTLYNNHSQLLDWISSLCCLISFSLFEFLSLRGIQWAKVMSLQQSELSVC